jgi:hypothetical protein
LQYLNVQQSLADTAQFIDHIKSGLKGYHQFVIIGGSYPGAMSAWFKHAYPTHVVASWSSSGVIDAIEDYQKFDYDIYDATNDSSPECAKIIHTTT